MQPNNRVLVSFEDIQLEVFKDESHDWLLETSLVAKGYEVPVDNIKKSLRRHKDELIEGKHFVTITSQLSPNSKKLGRPVETFWTKRGVIKLGFFLRSGKAKQFRNWAEDLILTKSNGKLYEMSMELASKAAEENELLKQKNAELKESINSINKQLSEAGYKLSVNANNSDHQEVFCINNYQTVSEFINKHGYGEFYLDDIIHFSKIAKEFSEGSSTPILYKIGVRFNKINLYHVGVLHEMWDFLVKSEYV